MKVTFIYWQTMDFSICDHKVGYLKYNPMFWCALGYEAEYEYEKLLVCHGSSDNRYYVDVVCGSICG